jgi:DNA-binding NarL/FixJ family response regulator
MSWVPAHRRPGAGTVPHRHGARLDFAAVPVRVLIVDDQSTFRAAARAVVGAAAGFEVVAEAASGEESRDAVREFQPDLVLMDVNLPGIDGVEATRMILLPGGGPTILLLSTRDPEEYAPIAADCGAAGYISKSEFSPRVLRTAWEATR